MRLRAHLLRTVRGGSAATGADDRGAVELLAAGLEDAVGLWGACGFALAPSRSGDVRVVDPPVTQLLEIGCHGGLPAGGGQIQLSTRAGPVALTTHAGEPAASVAARLALELARRGIANRVAENPATESSAGPSFDVWFPATKPAPELSAPARGPLSTDPALGVCLGEVDLADGLLHFEDETARAGTFEERGLLRAVTDLDPRTVDVVVVPYFSGRGRIGESFIDEGGGALGSVVVLDRAGLRATARSSTLAHELGHVLLAQPGHPEDFGRDDPSRLMDADASDATVFGPRRLLMEECRRALEQHGPGTDLPLLDLVSRSHETGH